MDIPKLRDGKGIKREPYLLNEFPDELIIKIAEELTYLLHIGAKDITGDQWGDIFASALRSLFDEETEHLASPVGIADVVFGKMAFSMKTVKYAKPFNQSNVRLISGRCSPDYSYGITDPHEDIQKTGTAVLGIWNERINIAHDKFNPVRTTVLVRSYDLLSYYLFEENTDRYNTNEFVWSENKNGNLVGKKGDSEYFTWQPHGSQFTIHTKIPSNAVKFKIKQPPLLSKTEQLKHINFDQSWVEIIRNCSSSE